MGTVRIVGAALRGRPRLEGRLLEWGLFKPRAATEGRPYSTFKCGVLVGEAKLSRSRWSICASVLRISRWHARCQTPLRSDDFSKGNN